MATLQVSGNNASYTLTLSGMSTSTRYHVFIADLSSSGSVTGYKCLRSSLGSSSTWTYNGSSSSPYSNYGRSVYVYTSTAATIHSVGTIYTFEEMRSGCTFMDSDTIPAADTTTYKVFFVSNAGGDTVGNMPSTITFTSGERVVIPYTTPTRSGHTFLGWAKQATANSPDYTAGSIVTFSSNTNLYAVWESLTKTYYGRLILYANGGNFYGTTNTYIYWPTSGNMSNTGTTGGYVSTNLPASTGNYVPYRDGYTFLGWADDPDATSPEKYSGDTVGFTATSTSSSNPSTLSYYAVWEEPYSGSISVNSYTYDSNDKSYQGILSVTVTLSPASGSWTLKATHSRTSTSVSKTITASGSTTLSTTLVLPYLYMSSEQTYTVTLTAPDGMVVDSIVVPCLDVPTYTLTFNANGGTGAPSALTTYGNVAIVTIPDIIPKLSKHKFLGWALGALSTVLEVAVDDLPCEYSLTYNKTLYAVWEELSDIELFFWNGSDTADAALIAKGQPVSNITAARWNRLLAKIKELADAVGVSFSYTTVSSGNGITAARFNAARTGLVNIRTALGTSTVIPSVQSSGNTVYATLFTGNGSLKSALNHLIGVYNNG